ncbi:uracil-DNA glycosylase [Buchnera aphidicola]|uniref:uracil-DNA glycosylase n=1 Tax=Buchnera aphidicola TaxID=9 RepID=UPI00107817DA|nr:uracil-DNA glycosylase [Buchnera aphidicola]VFP79134.1 Uracil-DNA glycosylase [Buchnera aphidicola (Cinara curtihirsuta)]
MEINKNISWSNLFSIEKKKKYFINLFNEIENIQKYTAVYPPKKMIFNAFLLTPLSNVKVVILGQDPYCHAGQAHGLSFSVPNKILTPPSLKNIFKELQNDFLFYKNKMFNCLEPWAKQGVLLLNSILTVSDSAPGSHRRIGWEIFTNQVIKFINHFCTGVVFLLWGSFSFSKYNLINQKKHFILKAPHPSPLSCFRGFFGCRHFSKTNKLLKYKKKQPINWFKNMIY